MSGPALALYWSETENDGRGYKRPKTGEQVPGVTSITGLVNKDLAQWGSDMAVKWISEHWYEYNPGQRSEESAFRAARYRWRDYRNERGQVGTNVHNHIENLILGKADPVEFLTPEEQRRVFQFEDFAFVTGFEATAAERQVWGGSYGGTLDAFGWMYSERLGRRAHGLIDWKTSKSAYFEYAMQLAALKNAEFQFVERAEATDDTHPLVKDGKTTHWAELPMPEVETAFVVHLTDDNWAVYELMDEDLHLARFTAYNEVWWAEKRLKEVLKTRGQKIDRPMDWFDKK